MRFVERDEHILKWINGFGFASANQIMRFMGVKKSACYSRLKKLVNAGYLQHEYVLHGSSGVYKVTQQGVLASCDHLKGYGEIRLGTFKHDLALVDLSLGLCELLGGSFIGQRHIRHDEGLSGVGKIGHVADGYYYQNISEKPVAIELELSIKGRARLHSIIEDYSINLSVSEVWYFCKDIGVKSALENAASAYSFIKIFDLADLSCLQEKVRGYG